MPRFPPTHPRRARYRRCLPAALMVWLLPPAGTSGTESRTFMGVSARVLPHTEVLVRAPQSLQVTSLDQARGTLNAAEPLTIRAYSNTPLGLEIDVQAPQGLFASMHVRGEGVDARLPGSGGTIAWRWSRTPGFTAPATLDLHFTFALTDATPEGRMVWPIAIDTRALVQ